MATTGLRDLYFADVTEAPDTGIETIGTPERFAGVINTKITYETADGKLYSDDKVAEVVSEITGGKVEIEIDDLTEANHAKLSGSESDAGGGVFIGSDDNAPYFVVGMRSKKAGSSGKFRYIWLYKVKFSVPDIELATKQDKIEFKTPTLKGSFVPLNKNSKCLYLATSLPTVAPGSTWFITVPEKAVV